MELKDLFRRMLPRVEHHPLGPRVFFLGVRWHDWHLGVAVLLALIAGALSGFVHDTFTTLVAGLVGAWLVVKDWRDLTSHRRDTSAWRLGLHRRPHPLRTFRRADPLPVLIAAAAASIATVDLVSVLSPNIAWQGHPLLQLGPVKELGVFRALALPVAVSLFVCAYYLYRRRLRALRLAVALLAALAVFNLLRGPDIREATGDFLVMAILWLGRGSFYVEHEPLRRRVAHLRAPLVAAAGILVSFLFVAAASQHHSFQTIVRETFSLLLWLPGPLTYHDEAGRLDLAVGLIGLATLATVGYLVFRPLAAPRDLPDASFRRLARELVRTHGSDTLAYFKLRRDKHYLFGADERAFLAYRVEGGVLLVSGEPVGPAGALPDLYERLAEFAERRGLRIAAIGVGEKVRTGFEQLGLRSLYIGDEAIVETATFSLEGREIRKVRQSVSRLEKAGFSCELRSVADLTPSELRALDEAATAWRGEKAERGFSMALDLPLEGHDDTLLLIAYDEAAAVRGYLHFVPSYGRPAVSLSAMRRDVGTPNGLTEFMIVKAIEALSATGVVDVSLNFAAFAKLLHSPQTVTQRILGRALRLADAYFQIESLYRFNEKFAPRWEPRYLMYEGSLTLPRTALATMWAEGHLPKPRLKLPSRRHSRRA